ncbi:MAG: ACP S-malonyltransferase [Gammaproteobacteria bacterium]|nr:ACP S-malonyltransferase [Gammaproteobacteria bacterium]MDH5593680.1 ACP S-malonyltransferase [Gammaproteobacteria bacterium]MDH5614451.1 ACP S-malonyltransferase [Gammaproteobacteria bacterium]
MTVAFIFPGQGSQSVGMLSELAEQYAEVNNTFSSASDVLGYDLWKLVKEGPDTELNQTSKTQPAMLAAGVATYRVWQMKNGTTPVCMAGHSLGEYTALVCSGAIAFEDAVSLVADRGRFMQEAVPEGQGAMAAILGLEDDVVRQVCTDAQQGDVVSAVNFNAPGQVVIAGSKDAVTRATELAKEQGAKRALLLPVSVPSHCALMKPAADQLAERMQSINISVPSVPVINNVDVSVSTDADSIRDALTRQLFSPVRWVETIQKMQADGVDNLIECGPGKVLVGLNKRIAKTMTAVPVFDPESLEKALQEQ